LPAALVDLVEASAAGLIGTPLGGGPFLGKGLAKASTARKDGQVGSGEGLGSNGQGRLPVSVLIDC
jgi:hypothetical protein